MRRSSNNSIFNPRARPIVSTLLQFTRNPPKYKGRGMNEVDRGENVSPVLSHECSNPSVPLSRSQISTPSFPAAASLADLQVPRFSHIGHTGPPWMSTRPTNLSPPRSLSKQNLATGKSEELSKLDSVVTSRSAQWLVPTPSSIISERAALPRMPPRKTLRVHVSLT